MAATMMIEPSRPEPSPPAAAGPAGGLVVGAALGSEVGDLPPHRDPGDGHQAAAAEVRLDQDPDHIVVPPAATDPRSGADAGLETEGAHPGAAADRAFDHRAAAGRIERCEDMLAADMEAVDVVQESVPGLGDHRQAPVRRVEVLLRPGDRRLVDRATLWVFVIITAPSRMPRSREPGGAGHLAVPVQREPGGEDAAPAGAAAGQHRGDAGADRAFADAELSFAPDDGVVPHLHSGDIGDRVEQAGITLEGHAEIAGAGRLLRRQGRRGEKDGQRGEGRGAAAESGVWQRVSMQFPVHGGDASFGAGIVSNRERGAPGGRGGRKRSVRNGGCGRSRANLREATRNRRPRSSA